MKPKIVPNSNKAIAISAAEKGFRLNGKRANDFRECEITFGQSFGSCEVVFVPGTRVFTQISASIGEPSDSRPGEGIMTVSTFISPSATAEMAGGGSGSKRPAIIARTIEKLFKEHRVVDLESLCIKFGERVWVLRIDIHILDTNGCLAEAAALSVLGGLLTFRRAQATLDINTNELIVQSLEDAVPVRLHLHHLPILTSFALTPSHQILAEPDQEEEEIFGGKLMVGVNDSKELCYLHVTTPINYDILSGATALAQVKCLERIKLMKELSAADDERRSLPVYMKGKEPRKDGREFDLTALLQDSSTQQMGEMSLKGKKEQGKSIPVEDIRVLGT